jgi:large conductance mechanosensitive channel
MLTDFRKFIMRGSVLDLAIGVVIGTAFTAIVNSLVDDIIMPVIGVLLGGVDFSTLSIQVGDATIAYGNFIQAVVTFLLISLVIFLLVRALIATSAAFGGDAGNLAALIGEEPEAAETSTEPETPSDEVVLLTEIRDLLAVQNN